MDFQKITQYERKLYSKGIKYVAGVDEVGRGPLAGPFVVSAVILDIEKILSKEFEKILETAPQKGETSDKNTLGKEESKKLNKKQCTGKSSINNDVKYDMLNQETVKLYTLIRDSKKVTPKRRSVLSEFIKSEAISYSIEVYEPEEIDKLGITELTQRAFFNSVKNLSVKPQYVLTDMFEIGRITKQHQTNIVNGDNRSISIASASIVAKVYRDNLMIKLHEKYPNYGFDKHKGYGTKTHFEALTKYGPCEIHRKSFEPIKSWIRAKK